MNEQMKTCRYCERDIEGSAVKTFGYWKGYQFWSHASCKVQGFKDEAYACQTLDADCNDCVSFQREEMRGKGVWIGRCANAQRNPDPRILMDDGRVKAYPNFCSGHPCFVHRRDDAKPVT